MDGVINVLKPPGMTSSNAVSDIRRLLGVKRVGHTGTLDPGAAGVLPICVGKATRLFDYLVDKDKEYICEITFGTTTDTLDAYGTVLQRDDRDIEKSRFTEVLGQFEGKQEQIPPIYSALKLNGKKLYELARKGETVDLESKKRTITIYKTAFLEQTGPNRFLYSVHCSKGTYIRTLCGDIAARLGSCGYMSFLLRTRTGNFSVENSYSIAELEKLALEGRIEKAILPIDRVLCAYQEVVAPAWAKKRLLNGNTVETELTDCPPGPVRIYCDGLFIGVGHGEAGTLTMDNIFADTTDIGR